MTCLIAGAGAEPSHLIDGLLVVLIAAAGAALIMQRIRVALIPAYLLTGALLGPRALGLVESTGSLEEIARLAIVLLLFGVGMELHLSALRHGLSRMLVAAS